MIRFEIVGIPPSANNAYFNLPKGGRALTKEGKKFKNETQTYLAQKYPEELRKFEKNKPYLVYMRFYFSDVQNATWGKPKGAESRYKRVDASNRAKLLEYVIKDVSGVDDSNTQVLILEKRQAKAGQQERTEVFIWNHENEESPFDVKLWEL